MVKNSTPKIDIEYFGSQWQITVIDPKITSDQVAEIGVSDTDSKIVPTHQSPIQLEAALVTDGKAIWILKCDEPNNENFSIGLTTRYYSKLNTKLGFQMFVTIHL